MGDVFNTSSRINVSFEKKAQERKKNILYLIKNYLQENGLEKTAENLSKEGNLSPQIEVCDNIDLDTIIQEYTSFYFAKFNKYPKLCKKTEIQVPKKMVTPKKPTISANLDNKPKNLDINEDFEICIKQISNVKVLEYDQESVEEYEPKNPEIKELFTQLRKEIIPKNLGVIWQDCIGLDNVIQLLQEAVVFPRKYPNLFSNLSSWKGVILYGPPGTGKTLVAKALASETGTVFINVSPSLIISKWRGESEKLVRTIFDMAKHYEPATIFIDEIDALASNRDEVQHEASRRFKSELLSQMDGLYSEKNNLFILATTNLPWTIDPAILRRFDKKIFINFPNKETRINLFKKYLNFAQIGQIFGPEELKIFAEQTENFTGSDIKLICKEANMNVIRKQIKLGGAEKICPPTTEDVMEAIKVTKPLKIDNQRYQDWHKSFGCT